MRPEKKYLVEEARNLLSASDHLFLVNFTGVTVSDASAFRKALAKVGAQFHIAKNSIIAIAAKELNLPDMSSVLAGPTAIISGGEDPAAVAKAVCEFFKNRENAEIKLGVLGEKVMTKEEVQHLGSLPSLPEMRAKFLSLLNTPAQQMVRVVFMRCEKMGGGEASAEAPAAE
jgi:large subunit ribosomal protein L10